MGKIKFKYKGEPTQRFIPNLECADYLRKSFEYDGAFVYGSLIEDKEGRTYIASSCQANSNVLLNNAIVTAIEVCPETVERVYLTSDLMSIVGTWKVGDIAVDSVDVEKTGVPE